MAAYPRQCYLCHEAAPDDKYVMLHCECCIALCKNCARKQVGLECNTFRGGVRCPKCRAIPIMPPGAALQICKSEEVEAEEKRLLMRAYDYHNIADNTRQSRQRLVSAFQRDGYLLFLENHRYKDHQKFVDLCLSRAECLRVELVGKNISSPDEDMSPEDLPLGPLEFIDFQHNSTLSLAISPAGLRGATCLACSDVMTPGKSVLFTCSCFSVMCQDCARSYLGALRSNYHQTIDDIESDALGIPCPTCRCLSFTITGGAAARNEETRLVDRLLKRIWANKRKSSRVKYTKSELQACHQSFVDENIEGLLSPAQILDFQMNNSSELNEYQVLLEIARLEVKRERILHRVAVAAAASGDIAESKISEDGLDGLQPEAASGEEVLPFGPLSKLRFKLNIFLEMALAPSGVPFDFSGLAARNLVKESGSSSSSIATKSASNKSKSEAAKPAKSSSKNMSSSLIKSSPSAASPTGTSVDSRNTREILDAELGSGSSDDDSDGNSPSIYGEERGEDSSSRKLHRLQKKSCSHHSNSRNRLKQSSYSSVDRDEEEDEYDDEDDDDQFDSPSSSLRTATPKRGARTKKRHAEPEPEPSSGSSKKKKSRAVSTSAGSAVIWECELCGKRLQSQRGLRSHMTLSHSNHKKTKATASVVASISDSEGGRGGGSRGRGGGRDRGDGEDDDDYDDFDDDNDDGNENMVHTISRTQMRDLYSGLDSPDNLDADSAYLCPHCQVVCVNARALKTHILIIHPDVAATIEVPCKVCGKILTAATMNVHMKRAHRKHSSSRDGLSDKPFSSSSPSSSAQALRPAEKGGGSGSGGSKTSGSVDMKSDFSCPFCSKELSGLRSLRRHIDRKHQEASSQEDSEFDIKATAAAPAAAAVAVAAVSKKSKGKNVRFIDSEQYFESSGDDGEVIRDDDEASSEQLLSDDDREQFYAIDTASFSTFSSDDGSSAQHHAKKVRTKNKASSSSSVSSSSSSSPSKRSRSGESSSKHRRTSKSSDPSSLLAVNEEEMSVEGEEEEDQYQATAATDATSATATVSSIAIATTSAPPPSPQLPQVDENGMRKSYKKVIVDESDDYSSDDDNEVVDSRDDGQQYGATVATSSRRQSSTPRKDHQRHKRGASLKSAPLDADARAQRFASFAVVAAAAAPVPAIGTISQKQQLKFEPTVNRSASAISTNGATSQRAAHELQQNANTATAPRNRDMQATAAGEQFVIPQRSAVSRTVSNAAAGDSDNVFGRDTRSREDGDSNDMFHRNNDNHGYDYDYDDIRTSAAISTAHRSADSSSTRSTVPVPEAEPVAVAVPAPATPSLEQSLASLRTYILERGASIPMHDFANFERIHPVHAAVINNTAAVAGSRLTDLFRAHPSCHIEFLAGWYYATGDDSFSSSSSAARGGPYYPQSDPIVISTAATIPSNPWAHLASRALPPSSSSGSAASSIPQPIGAADDICTAMERPHVESESGSLYETGVSDLGQQQYLDDPAAVVAAAEFVVGTRVEVYHHDEDRWFDATITYIRPDNAFDVCFDNNEVEHAVPIIPSRIRLLSGGQRGAVTTTFVDSESSYRQERAPGYVGARGDAQERSRGRSDDIRDDDDRGTDRVGRSRRRSRSRSRSDSRDRRGDHSLRNNDNRRSHSHSSSHSSRSRSPTDTDPRHYHHHDDHGDNHRRRRSTSPSSDQRVARRRYDDEHQVSASFPGVEQSILRAQGRDREQLLEATMKDLKKLRICIPWAHRICQNGDKCRFVHSNLLAVSQENKNIPTATATPSYHRSTGAGDVVSTSASTQADSGTSGAARAVSYDLAARQTSLSTYFDKSAGTSSGSTTALTAAATSKRVLDDDDQKQRHGAIQAERVKRVRAAMNIIVNTKQLPEAGITNSTAAATGAAVPGAVVPTSILSEEDVALLEDAGSLPSEPAAAVTATASAAAAAVVAAAIAVNREVQVTSLFRRLNECWKNNNNESVIVLEALTKIDLTKEELISNQESIKIVFALQKRDQSQVAATAKILTDSWLQQHRRSASQQSSSDLTQGMPGMPPPTVKATAVKKDPSVASSSSASSSSSSAPSVRPPLPPKRDSTTMSSSSLRQQQDDYADNHAVKRVRTGEDRSDRDPLPESRGDPTGDEGRNRGRSNENEPGVRSFVNIKTEALANKKSAAAASEVQSAKVVVSGAIAASSSRSATSAPTPSSFSSPSVAATEEPTVQLVPLTAASLAAINAAAVAAAQSNPSSSLRPLQHLSSSAPSIGSGFNANINAINASNTNNVVRTRPPPIFASTQKTRGAISWDEAALLLRQFAIDQGGHFLARDMQAFYARYDSSYDNLREMFNSIGPKKFVLKYPKLLSFNSRNGGMIVAINPKSGGDRTNSNRGTSNMDLPYGSDEEDIYVGTDSDDDADHPRSQGQHNNHKHPHDQHHHGQENRHPSLPFSRPSPPPPPTHVPPPLQVYDRRRESPSTWSGSVSGSDRSFPFSNPPKPVIPTTTTNTFSTAAFFLVPDDFDNQQLPPPPPPRPHTESGSSFDNGKGRGVGGGIAMSSHSTAVDRGSSQVIAPPPPVAARQLDYSKAWQILQTDEKLLDADRLKNYLRHLGVTGAEDLADCEESWIENITKLVKPLPLRQLNRFLGRDGSDS